MTSSSVLTKCWARCCFTTQTADRSPHFGTIAFSKSVWRDGGVHYPDTSYAEDYGFAERALDQGYKFKTLDNSDGCFTYVRHANTWRHDKALTTELRRHLQRTGTPDWVRPNDAQFFVMERDNMRATASSPQPEAVNYYKCVLLLVSFCLCFVHRCFMY